MARGTRMRILVLRDIAAHLALSPPCLPAVAAVVWAPPRISSWLVSRCCLCILCVCAFLRAWKVQGVWMISLGFGLREGTRPIGWAASGGRAGAAARVCCSLRCCDAARGEGEGKIKMRPGAGVVRWASAWAGIQCNATVSEVCRAVGGGMGAF